MPVIIWTRAKGEKDLQQFCDGIESNLGTIVTLVVLNHLVQPVIGSVICEYTVTSVAITYNTKADYTDQRPISKDY